MRRKTGEIPKELLPLSNRPIVVSPWGQSCFSSRIYWGNQTFLPVNVNGPTGQELSPTNLPHMVAWLITLHCTHSRTPSALCQQILSTID
ncbi:hypothetical protein DL95DRAFT_395336 [Leptodontidium sp. 2 PMI_412]|nr:hypothetical protein DL95DRAFT_395336 [Leptodontidium sp. 2 PMI_412]